jgi:hypothetical protein
MLRDGMSKEHRIPYPTVISLWPHDQFSSLLKVYCHSTDILNVGNESCHYNTILRNDETILRTAARHMRML